MRLIELQHWMAEMTTRPLTPENRLDRNQLTKDSATAIDSVISPSTKLTAIERLEIYNRGFWFRVLDSMRVDFPAVSAFTGDDEFRNLVVRYIRSNPSSDWTLRNLGKRFDPWLRDIAGKDESLLIAADIARLEWAYVEAYDAREYPGLDPIQFQRSGAALKLGLQPHVQLVQIEYAVQDYVAAIHDGNEAPPRSLPSRLEFVAVYRQNYSIRHMVLTPLGSLVLHDFLQWRALEEVFTLELSRQSIGPNDIQEIARLFQEWSRLGFFTSQQVADEASK